MSAMTQPTSPLDRPLTVTFFKNFAAAEKAEARTSMRGLLPRLINTTRDDKKKLPWLKLARFGNTKTPREQQPDGSWKGGSLRHDANMLGISGIEGDYDHEILTVDEALAILASTGIAAIVYTSPSHTEDAQRWRLLCPLSRDYDPPERDRFMARLNGLFQGSLSRESFARSQSYYYGSVRKSPSHRVEIIEGDALDLRDDLDTTAVGRAAEQAPPLQKRAVASAGANAGAYCQTVLRSALERVRNAADGTKHHTLRDQARLLGGFAHAAGWSRDAIVTELLEALPKSAKDLKAARNTAEWGFDAGVSRPLDVPARDNVVPIRAPEPPPHTSVPDEPTREEATSVPPVVVPEPEPPKLVWFDDIHPSLDALDFVEGVLIEGGAGVVYGESNAGKTFWTTDLALHVAAGIKWNGREVDQGGVIYCVLEGGIGFANRVSAWRKAKNVSGIPFAARRASLNLLNPDADLDSLITLITDAQKEIAVPVKLIVIDTLARAFAGGNENASEDMGALVQNMDRLRRDTGACVLFVHHSGKDAAKGSRGHSSLRAAIDTEIEVIASEGEEKTATVVKQRDLPKGDVFAFKLDVMVLGQNRRGKDVTTCLVTPLDAVVTPVTRQKSSAPLTENGKIGLRALKIALGKAGAKLPPLPDYPDNTWAVSVTVWRDELYQLKGGSPATNRQTFHRAENDLLAKNIITERDGFVWLVRDAQA